MKTHRVTLVALLSALLFVVTPALLASLTGCSKAQAPERTTEQRSAGVKFDPSTAATIRGVIHFSGPAPNPKPINMSADPDCLGQNQDESLVVHDGHLANVVVYVKSGLPSGVIVNQLIVPPVIHQRGCRYEPHVLAVLPGQEVTIENNDETTHNVHPKPRVNWEWNVSQLPHAEPLHKTFNRPELMVPVTCNVHPWMRAYINVMNSPFYAVTADDGSFTLQGLPPGTYTIAALHETLGEQTAQITVGPKETKALGFTFREGSNAASGAR